MGFLGFIFGASSRFFGFFWLSLSAVSVFSFAFLIFKDLLPRRIFLVLASSVMLGAVYSIAYMIFMPEMPAVGSVLSASGIIVDYPRSKLSSSVIEVDTKVGYVVATVPPFPEYKKGDRISLSGSVFSAYGRRAYLNYPTVSRLSRDAGRATAFFDDIRSHLLNNIRESLPVENSALAAGLLLGDDSGFSREFKAELKKTGTIHIVALSGWNVAIIISVIGKAFSAVLRRRTALIASAICVVVLILVAGPSASLIRAVIMGFVFIAASLIGREYSARNAVFFAAALMTLDDPSVPAYDLGFQLSFLAVLGMIYIAPILSSGLGKMKLGRIAVVLGLSDSLAAQIAILPVALSGRVAISLIGLLANTAVLIFVPYAFFLSFGSAVLGSGLGALSWGMSFGANVILSYEINAINIIGNIF